VLVELKKEFESDARWILPYAFRRHFRVIDELKCKCDPKDVVRNPRSQIYESPYQRPAPRYVTFELSLVIADEPAGPAKPFPGNEDVAEIPTGDLPAQSSKAHISQPLNPLILASIVLFSLIPRTCLNSASSEPVQNWNKD